MGTLLTPWGSSAQSPAAYTHGAEVLMRSSTTIPPVEPILSPAAAGKLIDERVKELGTRKRGLVGDDEFRELVDG